MNLPDISQIFTSNVEPYTSGVDKMMRELSRFAASNQRAIAELQEFDSTLRNVGNQRIGVNAATSLKELREQFRMTMQTFQQGSVASAFAAIPSKIDKEVNSIKTSFDKLKKIMSMPDLTQNLQAQLLDKPSPTKRQFDTAMNRVLKEYEERSRRVTTSLAAQKASFENAHVGSERGASFAEKMLIPGEADKAMLGKDASERMIRGMGKFGAVPAPTMIDKLNAWQRDQIAAVRAASHTGDERGATFAELMGIPVSKASTQRADDIARAQRVRRELAEQKKFETNLPLSSMFERAPGQIMQTLKNFPSMVLTAFKNLPDAIDRGLGAAVRKIPSLLASIPGMLMSAGTSVKNFFQGIFRVDSMFGLATTLLGVNAILYAMRTAFDAVTGSISHMISQGMMIERMQVTFGVLLGSMERGKHLFSEIQNLAIITPYTTNALTDVAQTLLGMGIEGDQIINTLRKLGDVAAGDSDRLKRLALAYGEVHAEGKLTGFRLRQFASIGIGAKDFAATMGISTEEFRANMRHGEVGSEVVAATINRLTGPMGRFAGFSTTALGTVYGQWERLRDVIDQTAGKVGKVFLESMGASEGISSLAEWIQNQLSGLDEFAAKAGKILGGVFREAGSMAGNLLSATGQVIGQRIDALGQAGAMPTMDQVQAGFKSFVDGLLTAGEMLAKTFAYLASTAVTVGETLTQLAGNLAEGFAAVFNLIPGGGSVSKVFTSEDLTKWGTGAPSSELNQWLKTMSPEDQARFRRGEINIEQGGSGAAGGLSSLARTLLTPVNSTTRALLDEIKRGPQTISDIFGATRNKQVISVALGKAMDFFYPDRNKPKIPPPGANIEEASRTPADVSKMITELKTQIGTGGNYPQRGTGRTPLESFKNTMEAIGDIEYGAKKERQLRQGKREAFGEAGPLPKLAPADRFGGLTDKETGMLKLDAYEKLRQATKGAGSEWASQLPTAVERGSADAMDAINRATIGREDVSEQIRNTLQAALEESEAHGKYLDEMNEAIKGLPKDLAALFEAIGVNG